MLSAGCSPRKSLASLEDRERLIWKTEILRVPPEKYLRRFSVFVFFGRGDSDCDLRILTGRPPPTESPIPVASTAPRS